MKNKNIKPTVIKCIAAAVCTLIIAETCLSNADKFCENKIQVSSGGAAMLADDPESYTDPEFEAQFADMEDTSSSDDTASSDIQNDADGSSADSSQAGGTSSTGKTSSDSKTTAAKKTITLTGGLSSTNIDEILEYYKLVSKKNSNLLFTKTLTLVSMDGGKNISQRMIDVFTPIAQKALAKNTITNEPYPGKPDKITAADWQAAKAVNDGTYTTLYIKVVPQTDSYNGSEYEGSCGRTMGVLDGIDRALQEMDMITVDFNSTKMTIKYLNPTVKVKVKNSTGELVKGECEWRYRTNPYIETMDAKFLAINIHLEGAGGYIDYSVKY